VSNLFQKASQLTAELRKHPEKFRLKQAKGRSELWETMHVVSLCSAASASASATSENQNGNEIDDNDIVGFVVCSICRVAFKYDAKTTGCSHFGRHLKACKPQVKKQILMTSLVGRTEGETERP